MTMENKEIIIINDYMFQDVIACALRYVIPRNTYVVSEICEWIEDHGDIISERILRVMERDVREQLKWYEDNGVDSLTQCDQVTLRNFHQWLIDRLNNVT